MQKYIIAIALALGLILMYQLIDINLLAFDFPRRVDNQRFLLFGRQEFDPNIVILNTGKLDVGEIESKIAELLAHEPKAIGINLCHLEKRQIKAFTAFRDDKRIILCNCDETGRGASAMRVEGFNEVTHFNSDKPEYFEVQVADGWETLDGRSNKLERIYYSRPFHTFYQNQLEDFVFDGRNKIFLVGYLGDYITEEIHDYINCRITPLNAYYGEKYRAPDMYDIQISANIVSMIRNETFIDEVSPLLRVAILLLFCLINVVLITWIQTRWILLNVLIYLFIFCVLMASGPALMVYLFDKNYFLLLNELTILLVITSISTVILGYRERGHKSVTRSAGKQMVTTVESESDLES